MPVSSPCFGQLFCPSSGTLDCALQLVVQCTYDVARRCSATSWVHYTTSCNTQSSVPEDGQNNCPKHVELIGIINKPLLLHLVRCLYYLFQWSRVKQISDNEIYLLIKYIKSVLWKVAKRLSYIEDAWFLKVKTYYCSTSFSINLGLQSPSFVQVLLLKLLSPISHSCYMALTTSFQSQRSKIII